MSTSTHCAPEADHSVRPTSRGRRLVTALLATALLAGGAEILSAPAASAASAPAASAAVHTAAHTAVRAAAPQAAAPRTGTYRTTATSASSGPTRNITDTMRRSVANGFGRAPLGGVWATSNSRVFTVNRTGGRISPLGGNQTARATISGVRTTAEVVSARFALPTPPKRTGGGTFLGVELRRQADGATYRARVRVKTWGGMHLMISRIVHGVEYRISARPLMFGLVHPNRTIAITARITGGPRTTITATAAEAGYRPVSVAVTDASPTRIAAAGQYGVYATNTPHSPTMAVVVQSVTGYRLPVLPPSKTPTPTPTPTPVPSTSDRGAPAPGATGYAVPSGAIVVSPSGLDTAAGTVADPFRTVAHAVAVAPTGTTIVLRAGSYHESVSVPAKKSLTFQAYPSEAVWFDGSVPVTSWAQDGATWTSTGWTAKFDATAGYTASQASAYDWLRPGYPMAAHPDMVFVDGTQLRQVATAAQVVAGTFFADYAHDALVIGSDPTGHDVRASDLQQALIVRSANTTVRGINFRRYATSVPQSGAVEFDGNGDRIQDGTITDMATAALRLTGSGQAVDHMTITDAGMLGLKTNMSDRLQLTNSVIESNNSEWFNWTPVAAGAKITRSDYVLVKNNVFEGNHGNGLWFDTSSYGMTVVDNDFLGNERIGLSFELSANGLIANNTASNNGFDGIRLCDTGTMRVWNNTMSGNAIRNFDIDQDSRVQTASSSGRDPRRTFPDASLDWKVKYIEVRNNVMIGGGVFHAYYADDTHHSPASRGVSIDHNLFSAQARRTYSPLAVQYGGTIVKYSLPQWSTYTGQGSGNVMSSGATSSTMDSSFGNTSQALPLPAYIADATGLATGARVWGRS